MNQIAKEIMHLGGKRRLRIYERSDGHFFFVEEALYENDYYPNAPFYYWHNTYRLHTGIYGSVNLAMAELANMPIYRDYEISN
jgi:hypothetical protein